MYKVDNSPEGQSSENNARNERRTVRSRLRYHPGPFRPEWTGPEEPGAPSPSGGAEWRCRRLDDAQRGAGAGTCTEHASVATDLGAGGPAPAGAAHSLAHCHWHK